MANKKIKNDCECCSMNKLSLNADKTIYIFFHMQRDKDKIPFCLPDLNIRNICWVQVSKLKFLVVFLNENVNW